MHGYGGHTLLSTHVRICSILNYKSTKASSRSMLACQVSPRKNMPSLCTCSYIRYDSLEILKSSGSGRANHAGHLAVFPAPSCREWACVTTHAISQSSCLYICIPSHFLERRESQRFDPVSRNFSMTQDIKQGRKRVIKNTLNFPNLPLKASHLVQ